MQGDAVRRLFVVGQRVATPGVAFVPCSVCRAPIDLAATSATGRLCAACAATLLTRAGS